MSIELWILVGVAVGLVAVFAVYKLGGASKGTAIASAVAVVTAGLAAFAAIRKQVKQIEEPPPPTTADTEATLQPVLDVAHEANDAARREEEDAVDEAIDGPSPEEDLAALGDSRRRR